jgi:MFS family permease
LIGDFFLFSIGYAFYDPFIVVPAFVSEFTGSELMVGVLSALRVLMITVPQVWAASVLVARPRMKPLLVWSSIGGRLPILFLAVVTYLWAGEDPWMVSVVLCLSVALFFTSEGLNGISWPALVGKAIPAGIRGRFFGAGQFLSSLGALGAGYIVRVVLGDGGAADPMRWTMLYLLAFLGLMLSVVCMLFIHEEPAKRLASPVNVGKSVRRMVGYLRTDAWLQRIVGAQLALGTAAAVFPFYVVRARELVRGGDQMIGVFLVVQNLGGIAAALVVGPLVDRVGSRSAIRLVAVVQTASLFTALLGSLSAISQALYLGAFFLLGFVAGSSWWSYSAYLLDMATGDQRPIYLAASSILTSPVFLGSIVVGALFEVMPPEAVFGGALALSTVGAMVAWGIPRAVIKAGELEDTA